MNTGDATNKPHVLWIGPNESLHPQIPALFSDAGYQLAQVEEAAAAHAYLTHSPAQLVFLVASQVTGLAQLMTTFAAKFIIVVDHTQVHVAAQALQQGALDYLIYPFGERQLLNCAQDALSLSLPLPNLIACAKNSTQVLQLARRAAKTDATIMISGESGTGKERLARYIHESSSRASGPFVAINCAAIPESMLESILFGHVKGAFTGAISNQAGKFEHAQGGTLLLDEISEMPLALQAKLLRVLQERVVERLGGGGEIRLDVRIIATSNRNMQEFVRDGLFRSDLYFRLDVIPLVWPPLRERPADIIPLANYFINLHAPDEQYTLSHSATQALLDYLWPGNVRELDNVVQRALVMARGLVIQAIDLMLPLTGDSAARELTAAVSPNQLASARRHADFHAVIDTLRSFNGNRTKSAAALGITTRALRYKLVAMKEQGLLVD